MSERRWRQAVNVLLSAEATSFEPATRGQILELLAVAAADGGKHQISSDAVYELKDAEPRSAATWVTFSQVALARTNFVHADAAARSALELEPTHQGAWAAMAAGYAGLGWFEEADRCLDRLDRDRLSDLEQWRIGRAINRWAMSNTPVLAIALLSAILFGVLAIAVAASVPFAARQWRLLQMSRSGVGEAFTQLADNAWRHEHRMRITHALVVALSVASYLALKLLL